MYPTTWWPWSEYACQYMPMPSHALPACDATARSLGTMVLAGPNHHRRQCREGRAPESGNVTWNVTWISTPSLHWFCGYLNHFEASSGLFGTGLFGFLHVSPHLLGFFDVVACAKQVVFTNTSHWTDDLKAGIGWFIAGWRSEPFSLGSSEPSQCGRVHHVGPVLGSTSVALK